MINKKEFLLESIIQAYIGSLEPIGSVQLKQMYDLDYSSATIRAYFKKLGDEGYLIQEHISSGRVPTNVALIEYWKTKMIDIPENVDLKLLKYFTKELGLSVAFKKEQNSRLVEVKELDKRSLVLCFSDFVVSVNYSLALSRFLQDLIGFEVDELINIAKQVGAYELYYEVSKKLYNNTYQTLNLKEYLKMAIKYDMDEKSITDFIDGTIFENLKEGIYFDTIIPKGYMLICSKIKINQEKAKMITIGDLTKNYNYFYERIAA
ncbi:MAG: heat-shock protein [Arcobacter butzleri]|jgi:heat-inducible transcriptional repressor|nr:heat-shock protein [Arcobacteraceae bacterium]MDY0365288.1 heat-shock protein [Arcobacteraceae bacterium]NLO17126.1 heat-shock protein [Aliarcobacter butzleri]